MVVTVNSGQSTWVPGVESVSIVMNKAEAQKLRRACYYNVTLGDRYSDNPVGGDDKGNALQTFMGDLGAALKAKHIDRF